MKFSSFFFYIFSTVIMYGCAVNFKAPKGGEVVLYHRFYDSLNNNVSDPYFTNNDTIFFFDSLVVFKVKILCNISDIFQNQTYEYKLCKYTFLDLRTMIYYDYKSFNDTSILIRKYDLPPGKFVNWGFHQYREFVPSSCKSFSLSDTLIEGVFFKRLSGTCVNPSDSLGMLSKYTYYMDCSKEGSIFHIDRAFDEKYPKCPALRFDFKTSKNKYTISTSYRFTNEKLTNEQRKIFKKWEYNASNNSLPLEHRLGNEMEDCPSCE